MTPMAFRIPEQQLYLSGCGHYSTNSFSSHFFKGCLAGEEVIGHPSVCCQFYFIRYEIQYFAVKVLLKWVNSVTPLVPTHVAGGHKPGKKTS